MSCHASEQCVLTVIEPMLLCAKDHNFNPIVFTAGMKIPPYDPVQKWCACKVHSSRVTTHQWGDDVGIGVVNSASSYWVDPFWVKSSHKKISLSGNTLLMFVLFWCMEWLLRSTNSVQTRRRPDWPPWTRFDSIMSGSIEQVGCTLFMLCMVTGESGKNTVLHDQKRK